jgi:hypothetical protein
MGDRRGSCRVLLERERETEREGPVGKRPLGRPRNSWMIILKWVFKMWDGEAWIGLIWIRIGTGVGYL